MVQAELAHAVDRYVRRMSSGFGVEIVLAFPVIDGVLGLPVIASAGTHDRARLTPGRAFRYALRQGAEALAVGHNHPDDTGPSEADRAVTRRLVAAGTVIGVPLLAHVVSEPSRWHEIISGRSSEREPLRVA